MAITASELATLRELLPRGPKSPVQEVPNKLLPWRSVWKAENGLQMDANSYGQLCLSDL